MQISNWKMQNCLVKISSFLNLHFIFFNLQWCLAVYFKLLNSYELMSPARYLGAKRRSGIRSWIISFHFKFFQVTSLSSNLSTGCCPNPFSLVWKRFLINLRLAPGDFKTRPSGSNSWNRLSSASPRFISTKRFKDRSKEFLFGQQPVNHWLWFVIHT